MILMRTGSRSPGSSSGGGGGGDGGGRKVGGGGTLLATQMRRMGGGFRGQLDGGPAAPAPAPAAPKVGAANQSPGDKKAGVSIQSIMSPAPDGSMSRSSVGIGEQVRFVANLWTPATQQGASAEKPEWSVSTGTMMTKVDNVLTWNANQLGRAEITCKVPGHGSDTIAIEVVAPSKLEFQKASAKTGYRPFFAGVGMNLKVTVLPLSVEFPGMLIKESGSGDAGKAKGLRGYFAHHGNTDHNPHGPGHIGKHNVMDTRTTRPPRSRPTCRTRTATSSGRSRTRGRTGSKRARCR